MCDLIENGLRWLDGQRSRHVARWVTYARGPSSITIRGTKTKSTWSLVGSDGTMFTIETIDWLISSCDLRLDGIPVEPKQDDKIIDGDLTYQVLAPDKSMPHFRYCDAHRITMSIYAKLVKDISPANNP